MKFPIPQADVRFNTSQYEMIPLIKPTGFREYDARWIFEKEINLMGIQALGMGLGSLLGELGVDRQIVVAHDYRAYSASIKMALVNGLLATGCQVTDIGLAVSPMAYFAQFDLDIPAVAMVTASHNDNGWTGVKMGADRPKTFGPEEMGRLRQRTLNCDFDLCGNGTYQFIPDFAARYIDDLTARKPMRRNLRAVVATGNGTAGLFAPSVLQKLGVEIIPLETNLDHTFPSYNPNPEALAMLNAVKTAVVESKADIGLAFDGDGDRCGVVDNNGEEIFADKVGVMIARDLSELHENARFVVDVKSTGLFDTDPVLRANGVSTEYWKTGHSYIKRRVSELGALAGFEKSGHFFFNAPIGRGYDDGLVAALAILDMLDRAPDKQFSDLRSELTITYQSPTMSPHCDDECKYQVVEKITERLTEMARNNLPLAGQPIRDLITVNGARAICEDGTWGLVRASSNMPELVVVVESPVSEERKRKMFAALDVIIREHEEVGAYNQTLDG